MNQIERLLTPKEVATILQLGKSRIYWMLRSGELPSVRVSGKAKLSLRVRPSALEKWMKSREVQDHGSN